MKSTTPKVSRAVAFPVAMAIAAGLAATPALAQCTSVATTSLLQGFRAIGNPVAGQVQSPASAWAFRRVSENGPLVLGGLCCGGAGAGWWETPGASFLIPVVGPVMSPDPLQNQNQFFDRPASFTGVFFHPGNDAATDVLAVFSPQASVTITGIELQGEVVGSTSNGILLSLSASTGGVTQTLLAPGLIPYTVAGSSTRTTTTPITLAPGDRLWLRGNNNGSPFQDWGNVDVRFVFTGGPVLLAPPRASPPTLCAGGTSTLTVEAVGSGPLTYQWRKGGNIISGAQSASLTIANATPDDAGVYDCVVTGPCASVTSGALQVGFCFANCDCSVVPPILNAGDFTCFLTRFRDAQSLPLAQQIAAYANCDGSTIAPILNPGDFSCFLNRFRVGCP